MRHSIDTYIQGIAHDNAQYIREGGFESIADYIYTYADSGDCWYEFFDDEELEGEPSKSQVSEVMSYLFNNYNYMP